MQRYGIIYKITNKINGKVYIGQTIRKYGFKDILMIWLKIPKIYI